MHELDQLIMSCDADKSADFFVDKSEKERKPYVERTLHWCEAMFVYNSRRRKNAVIPSAFADNFLDRPTQHDALLAKFDLPKDYTDASLQAVQAVALSVCGMTELKKADCMGLPPPELALRILLSRKPTWIAKWCQFILKEFPATHWTTLYALEAAGVYNLERNSSYWVAMAGSLGRQDDLVERLTKDDKLRLQLWDMLAEPAVNNILNEPEEYSSELTRKRWRSGSSVWVPNHFYKRVSSTRWRIALLKLSDVDLLDKHRLIEYSFSNLAHIGEKEYRKNVYSHDSTANYAVELNKHLVAGNESAHVNQYIALIGAAHKDVSLYASTVLSALPPGTVSATEVCSCIGPVFINKAKEPAEAALKLLAQLTKQHPAQRAEFGPAMIAALGHSSKEVNKKALALIESTKILQDPALLAEFHQRVDMLQGMERTNAVKLASKFEEITATTNDTAPAASLQTAANADELIARVEALDKSLKSIARVDEAVHAVKTQSYLDAPVALDSMEIPRLNPAAAIEPIDNLDDLIYRYTRAWSDRREPMSQEAVMDGVSRMCDVHPPDFVQKTNSLREKATKEEPEFVIGSRIFDYVAARWLGVPVGQQPKLRNSLSFTDRRFTAVGARAESKQAAPLLAAPTHAGGWIEPKQLVDRMIRYAWLQKEPQAEDFVQALLRLAPDNRDSALQAAAPIRGEMGAALRYALGSDTMQPLATPEFWIAAYRSRYPKGNSPELLKWLPNAGPDGAEAAQYGLDLQPLIDFNNDRYASISKGLPDFLPVQRAAVPSTVAPESPKHLLSSMFNAVIKTLEASANSTGRFPPVMLHDNANTWIANSGTLDWLHNRESLFALLAKRVLQNIESVGSYWHGDFEFMFDPDVSLADNGRYLILFAMSSKNNDFARLAVDALIAAIGETRVSATTYGEAMAWMLPSGVITNIRWTRGLRDAARTSAMHAAFVWQAVSTIIEKAKISATQQIPFLELLVELQVENGFKPSAALTQALSANTGTTKGAKLSKAIMSSAQPDKTTALAAVQDLEARISRVERWQNWKISSTLEAVAQSS